MIIIIFFYIAPIVLTFITASPFIFLLTIGIWIFNTIILYYVSDWYGEVSLKTPKLSYRTFIKLYDVMPEDFTLRCYDFYYKNTLVDFKTFFDWWCYRKFYRNIEKHKAEQEQLQRQTALISELQRGLAQEQIFYEGEIK